MTLKGTSVKWQVTRPRSLTFRVTCHLSPVTPLVGTSSPGVFPAGDVFAQINERLEHLGLLVLPFFEHYQLGALAGPRKQPREVVRESATDQDREASKHDRASVYSRVAHAGCGQPANHHGG